MQSGRHLRLGTILGKGGEGTIFHVDGDASLAVKIYTNGSEATKLPKIRAMLTDRLADKTSFVAFPLDVVQANGRFVGFVMRKAPASK